MATYYFMADGYQWVIALMLTTSCNKLHAALCAVGHALAIYGQQWCRRLTVDGSRSVGKSSSLLQQ